VIRSRRLRTGLVVAAAVGLGTGGALVGNSLSTAGSGSSAAAAAKKGPPKVVARVRAVSSKRLYAKRRRGGRVVGLAKGDKVFLHDIVAIGPRTTARLRLSIPRGLRPQTDLLDLYRHLGTKRPKAKKVGKQIGILLPFAKTHRTLKLIREGKHIEARLSR
jgi:hypothetical protein